MALSEDTVRELREMLPEATALVYVAGQPIGTAFFISDDLLLTCAHVGVADTVTIRPFQREGRSAEVISRAEPDLALLRTPHDGKPSPCVVLGRGLDSYDCLVAGYPRLDGADPGSEVRSVQVHLRKNVAGSEQSLIIDPGQIITYGMSGGPVVSTGTGAVVAIVRTSKDPTDALGGSAIPISLAAKAFREVEAVLGNETLVMIPWRDVLGPENWRRLGRSWDIEERIDLTVIGHRNRWTVRIEAAGWTMTHKDPDLGERVAEAIFHWARRRHMRGVDEVALLGQLLTRALFPDPVPAELDALGQADGSIVRLHVAPDSELADIPWELAADPFSRDRDRFLAAARSFRFTRVVDKPAEVSSSEPKPRDNVEVLAVFAQPADWKYADVPGPHGGKPYSWPGEAAVRADLRNSIESGGFTLKPLVPPTPDSVYGALEDGAYDVLHYMGTGRRETDGKALIAFVSEDGHEQWEEVHSILQAATRARVRLVILELMMPPEDRDVQQLTYSSLGDVIQGSIEAAVLTNLPVHPDQCKTFNREFYRVLGQGQSVETATQLARRRLQHAKPVDDAAGFGWFTVVTGRRSGIHLVIPPPRDPTLSGARQPVPGTGEPPLERPNGAFSR